MQFDDSETLALKTLAKKNSSVSKLLEFYNFVISSPFYDSYVSIRVMMAGLNHDLKSGEVTLFVGVSIPEDGGGAVIDEKTFVNAHKYATEIKYYHEQLKYLRDNMTPEKIKEAEEEIASSLTVARKGLRKQIENNKS